MNPDRLFRRVVPGVVAAAALVALSACAGSPKRPYDSGSSSARPKTLAEQCRDAEFTHTVPPAGCPQTTTTSRQRTLPDLPLDSTGGLGFPGGVGAPSVRLPR